MKSINWNELSQLGLVELINRETLHPLGLAITIDPETGISKKIIVSPDGGFHYKHIKPELLSDDVITKRLNEILLGRTDELVTLDDRQLVYLSVDDLERIKLSARAEGVFDAISTIPSANYFGSNFVSLTALNNFGVSLKQKAEK
jgi:hypothetical protein